MRNHRALASIAVCLVLLGCSRKPHGPVLIYRNNYGSIDLLLNPAPIRIAAGGVFDGEPAAVRFPSGDVLVAVRDQGNCVWTNSWQQATWKWKNWLRMTAVAAGKPAIAYSKSKQASALLAIRDPNGGYWTAKVSSRGDNPTPWVNHQGVFQSDPVLVHIGNQRFLLAGIDPSSVAWSMLVNEEGGVERGWTQAGAVLKGDMCGVEANGAALFVGRDTSNVVGLLRVSADGTNRWTYAGQKSTQDPVCTQSGDDLLIGAVDGEGHGYISHCSISSSHCGEWTQLGAAIQSTAVAIWGQNYHYFVRTNDNSIARWSSDLGWRGLIWGSYARGSLAALSIN